jgi:hypothetical protein
MMDTGDNNIIDDTHELISSIRVEGTPVFNREGEKLGTLHSVMINKKTGQVAYALLLFGGFLGIGSHVHPLPWSLLDYNAKRHGYVVDLSREVLERAPLLHLDEADRPSDRSYDERLYDYYGAPRYWGL